MRKNRFDQMIDAWDPILRKAFRDSVYEMRDRAQIEQIARMLEKGDVEGAVRAVGLDPTAWREFDRKLTAAFEAGGNATAAIVPVKRAVDGMRLKFQFNVRNPAAERWLSDHSSTKITEIVDDQRIMVREHLLNGMKLGNGPRATALDLVGRIGESGRREGGAIGLTSGQEAWVRNYRADLQSDNPRAALSRSLRDGRFDRAVIRAAESGAPIKADLIDSMVEAYRNRALRYRAEAVARTEAMASLHEAQQQSMEQAVQSGLVDQSAVSFVWRTARDDRVREAHLVMNGQRVAMGEKFVDGDGNELEFPGDPLAPPETTINCRCWREPDVNFLAGIV